MFCSQIIGDAVGWGFVVRGSKPCHIQAVDPGGPAAAAGMKVKLQVADGGPRSFDEEVVGEMESTFEGMLTFLGLLHRYYLQCLFSVASTKKKKKAAGKE